VTTIDDLSVTEGSSGVTIASVKVRFAPPLPPRAHVELAIVGGTARDGEDFVGGPQGLYPPPGATSMTVAIRIVGDQRPECDEGIFLSYQGIGTGDETLKEAKLLIVDDDHLAVKDACPDPFATRSTPLGPDAGAPNAGAPDAGAPDGDAASTAASTSSGCGCAVGDPPTGAAGALLLALGLALRAKRSR
jgi:MYXO-CTERM domain-containing protein